MVFLPLLFELRSRKVKVGPSEAMALARALSLGLHENSLDGFYRVARALWVHSETDLDAFDEAFGACFREHAQESAALVREFEDWLRNPRERPQLTPEQLEAIEALDLLHLSELRRLFDERLREQTERHDGGSRWIGTGGTSPFGARGTHPTGVRVGAQGGGRSAAAVADARAYRPYRSDVVLDVRQMDVALRKLRALAREGTRLELDVEGTVEQTAANGGELEVVVRPPKRPNVRVLLLMDVGGSMDPHAEIVSRLFSAARRASSFRELETFYFHNCVYSRLYRTGAMREVAPLRDVLERCTREWKLVIVGDAAMHPLELHGREWQAAGEQTAMTGAASMQLVADHFERSAWLNPDPPRYWKGGTAEALSQMFAMFPLTLDGLGAAVAHLSRKTHPAPQ